MKFAGWIGTLAMALAASTAQATVYHVATIGSDKNPGTAEKPFRTINKGAQVAQPGDTVMVHAGIYRERVIPARGGEEGRPITYEAAPGEVVYVKGSDVWNPDWREMSAGIYRAKLDESMFTDNVYVDTGNPFHARQHQHRLNRRTNRIKQGKPALAKIRTWPGSTDPKMQPTCGQVVVNGRYYREVWSVESLKNRPCRWCFSDDTDEVFINFATDQRPPAEQTVEITTRRSVFKPIKRGLGYISVRGFIFEHCGNPFDMHHHALPPDAPRANSRNNWGLEGEIQSGMVGTRCGHHWIIEDNVFRLAKSMGLDCGMENLIHEKGQYNLDNHRPKQPVPPFKEVGYHIVRNNIFAWNGSNGIMADRVNDLKIINNVFVHNNFLFYDDIEEAAIKLHHPRDGEISDNYFAHNWCSPIWIDGGAKAYRVFRNLMFDNEHSGVRTNIQARDGDVHTIIEHNIVIGMKTAELPNGFKHPGSVGVPGPACGIRIVANTTGVRIASNLIANCEGDGIGVRERCYQDLEIVGNVFLGNKGLHISLPYPKWGKPIRAIRDNVYDSTDGFASDFSSSSGRNEPVPKGEEKRKLIDEIVARWKKRVGGDLSPLGDLLFERAGEKSLNRNTRIRFAFKQWSGFYGFDQQAIIDTKTKVRFDPRNLTVRYSPSAELIRLTLQPMGLLKGVDWNGRALSGRITPGPAQANGPGGIILRVRRYVWKRGDLTITGLEDPLQDS